MFGGWVTGAVSIVCVCVCLSIVRMYNTHTPKTQRTSEGDARRLYQSVHTRIFCLPAETLIYPGMCVCVRARSRIDVKRPLFCVFSG